MSAPRSEAIAIIGSGPAAWTAAIYAARANLNPIVFEGEQIGTEGPGGQLMLTTDIENFPGFPEAITGPDLMARMKQQAEHYGTRVVSELITAVDFSQRPFVLTPHYSAPITAHTVVVATGAAARWIGLENEIRLAKIGGGVSACAVCDGALPFYRNKRLAVVGGGYTAMEEALYLTKFASEVAMCSQDECTSRSEQSNSLPDRKSLRLVNQQRFTLRGNSSSFAFGNVDVG